MTSNFFRLPLRMLALGALCITPMVTMATNLVSVDRSQSVVHASSTWLKKAGPTGWAGDRFAMQGATSAHPMSFAHGGRERVHGSLAAAAVFSRDDVLTHRDVWSANFLSNKSAAGPLASITTPVPEPGTYALMVAGLAAIGFVMRRRTRS